MKNLKWIIQQTWQHVVFLHFDVEANDLQQLTPFPLDLFENKAILSIVPFFMNDIRFPYTPKIPAIGKLWELNLRTYVEVNGVKGIYFFTLETDNWISEKIAQVFFNLPYHYSKIQASVYKQKYNFTHSRKEFDFNLIGNIGEKKLKTKFDTWTTERYHLFCQAGHQFFRGDTIHPAWDLREFHPTMIMDNFSSILTSNSIPKLTLNNQLSASYCERLEVRFKPFEKIKVS